MSEHEADWQREIDRRAVVYDAIEAGGDWQGRMSALDYLGLAVLTVVLVGGFWIWGV